MADAEATSFAASGLEWTAESEYADFVRTSVADRLVGLEDAPGVEILKRNLVRTVLRVPVEGPLGHVIVKRYRVGGPLDWVKYSVRDSRAMAEWKVGRGLTSVGVPTAVPFAMAELRSGVLRDAALVTREIRDALHLNAYVEAHLQGSPEADARRLRLYRALGALVRRMHAAGFVHNDLHGGNVLVNGPPAEAELHIIDLHSVTRTDHPSAGARWFDLVKLLHSMMTCSTEEERLEICRAYEDEGGRPSGTLVGPHLARGDLGAVLEPRLRAMERKRVKSRTKRCLVRSSRCDISRVDGYRIHHLRKIPADAFLPLLRAHDETMASGGPDVLKDARRSALSRQTLETPDGPRVVVVKEYRITSLLERLKNTVRRPRAITAWIAGNGLLVRRFQAAEPIALLLRGRGPLLSRAFLVMDDLGEGNRADLVVLQRFAGELGSRARREKHRLVAACANLLRRLHAAGVYHADMKAVNLFVDESGDEPRVVLADYDRVMFDRVVSGRRRIKNLAQLSASVAICVTLADRLRFFRAYARGNPGLQRQWKGWFRRVIAECERKIVVRMEPIE